MSGPIPFGRFWLHERIGRGGMADVYRATLGDDPYRFTLEFALKRMHEALLSDMTFVDMFLIEEYVQGLLNHPNIIRMFEAGQQEIDGQPVPYIAMEFIRGRDLDSLLERTIERKVRMPLDVAVGITLEILKAIDYAHRAISPVGAPLELIHRDITPGNIYVGFDGKVKLGDFGVARIDGLEPQEEGQLLKGKVAYVAPETLLGEPPTQRDDLWSLAVCFYEMLASARYFPERSDDAIMRRVGAGKLPVPKLPRRGGRDLRTLVETLLHPRASKRPQTAVEFYRELKAFAQREGLRLARDNVARFVISMCGDVDVFAHAQEVPVRDRLTGAMSDRYLHQYLTTEADRARRYQRALSVVSFDIDDFHRVNRVAGASAGDDLLTLIVRAFLPGAVKLRSCDVVARRRADHFTLVLPETPFNGAKVVADRLCVNFRGQPWAEQIAALANIAEPLTVRVGIATLGTNGLNATELLQASDAALASAKRAGGNRVAAGPRLGTIALNSSAARPEAERGLSWEMHEAGDQALPVIRLAFETDDELLAAYADDMQGGGLRMRVEDRLRVESEVRLHIALGHEERPLSLRARVCWTGRNRMVGFQFLEPALSLHQRVEELLWRPMGENSA
ncbi:MAG: diguanylate cyclase [Myxococcota bacterium]